jgi:outer membrane protein assembly factor BamE
LQIFDPMRTLVLISALCVGLAGCKSLPSLPKLSLTPYKIDIQQGNVLDQDAVAKLKPGLTRAQVRFIMGTPLVTDIYHANRWDYVYIDKKAGKLVAQRRVVVFFDGDVVKSLYQQIGESQLVELQTPTVAPVAEPVSTQVAPVTSPVAPIAVPGAVAK